jgi:hypothetical protein
MLMLHVPTLLALLGTALMAVVIFAPAPAFAPRSTASEVYSPLPFEAFAAAGIVPLPDPPPLSSAVWPALVDPSAAQCDAGVRLALVDALAAVRRPWADAILRRALDEEPDARVRAAIEAARIACEGARPPDARRR